MCSNELGGMESAHTIRLLTPVLHPILKQQPDRDSGTQDKMLPWIEHRIYCAIMLIYTTDRYTDRRQWG